MKTMTCGQLGGPCDHEHRGGSADDMKDFASLPES
jgi:hypothetical protein